MSLPKPILGRELLAAMENAGIIERGDLVRRVVIDAHVENIALLYVERVGDDRLLKIAHSLDGIQVQGVPMS